MVNVTKTELMMRAMGLLVAVLTFSTQGCASALREMSRVPSDRPSVASGPSGVSGGGYIAVSVPSTLPLPIKADARTRMAVPNPPDVSHATYTTLKNVYVFLACMPVMGSLPASCEDHALGAFDRNIKAPTGTKGPVILR